MTTTITIANIFGKTHKKVNELVRQRMDEGTIAFSWVKETTYLTEKVGKHPTYELNLRATLEIVGSFTGVEQRKIRKTFLDALLK